MKWFVGLGNPGSAYERTRHNVGFMTLDVFADKWGIGWKENGKCRSIVGEGSIRGTKVYLLKPQTYMNLSGEAVRAFMDYYKAPLEDMTVLYDDLDTPFGQLRMRYQGSAGGHNGIKSIIQHTGKQTFNRIRIGISRPQAGSNIADYVLSNFRKEEFQQMGPLLGRAADAMDDLLDNSFEKTMAKFNG